MSFATDWSLNYTTKEISYIGAGTRWTVRNFYSELMDLFDDAGQMDDQVPMSAQTPKEFKLINGWDLSADTDYQYLYEGSIIDEATGDVWASFYSIGTINAGSVIYFEQDGALVPTYTGYTSGHIDQLIKVAPLGVPTNGSKITAYIRNLGDTYDHYEATASATGGWNPIPFATETDSNDGGTGGAVTGVTIAFGTASKDIGDGAGAVDYSVVVDGGGNSTADVYKYLKYITRRENNVAIDTPENTTEGRFYQLANAAYSPTKKAPFGSFAGGKFFGAQGVWLENTFDPNNRELKDNAGVVHAPPNSITVAVSNVVAGDQVLVAKATGNVINKSQYTISSATASTVVATLALGADTPATGTLRVGDTRYTYTGWSGSTFTGVSPSPAAETGDFFVPMIDDVAAGTSMSSAAMIYSADFDVVGRVRKYGILPFENTGTVTNAGLTISAIRTTDSIVA